MTSGQKKGVSLWEAQKLDPAPVRAELSSQSISSDRETNHFHFLETFPNYTLNWNAAAVSIDHQQKHFY